MAVIRVEKTQNYSVMSNYHFKEKSMSLKSMGLLSLMLSLPDGWEYSVEGLSKLCADGETAIETALSELKTFGFVSVKKLMPNETKSGRIEYIYTIYEQPHKDLLLDTTPSVQHSHKTLLSLTTNKKDPPKTTKSKSKKTHDIINSIMKSDMLTNLSIDIHTLLRNWLEELYEIGKGISKNSFELNIQYLQENIRKDCWEDAIKKCTLHGWRSFEYYKPESTKTQLKTNQESQQNRETIKKQMQENKNNFI